MSRPAPSPVQHAEGSVGTPGETTWPASWVTAGNLRGHNAFIVGLGAPVLASDLLQAGQAVPDLVLLDFNHLGTVPKLENYLFFQLFCSAAQDGIGAELGRVNQRIMVYERQGIRAPDAELAKRDEIVERAKRKGFAPILTPSVPIFLSRRLTVFVLDEGQQRRVQDLITEVFIHRDEHYFAQRLRDFQRQHPGQGSLSETAIRRITAAFDRARSFVSGPGLFCDPHTGKPFPDAVIREQKLKEIIDIRVVGPERQSVTKGCSEWQNAVEVWRSGDWLVLQENGRNTAIPSEALRANHRGFRRWRPKGLDILRAILRADDAVPRLIDFGTGDALYVGTGEDFTNFALVYEGRLLLHDPSETTIRNLIDLNLLNRVEVIYLSHIHYDHIGGILELANRFLNGERLPRFPLLTSKTVYVQALDVLQTATGRGPGAFENLFSLLPSSDVVNSRRERGSDGDVEVVRLPQGAFEGFTGHLMRTYGHPLPTYALKLITPNGIFAYLVDSTMPPRSINGQPCDRFDDFLSFFGERAGVDILIADAGGLEGRQDNVHIAPSELLDVFPEHARRGTLWGVHSPLAQKAKDLQRFEPFDVIEICPYEIRLARMEAFAHCLLTLGAFRNRQFRIDEAQAARLGRVAVLRRFRQGDRILTKHDDVRNPENNKVHVILRGEVSVAEEGREIREGERLGPGDLFGERAIFGAEVAAMAYWQIPERRRAKVLTRHEFESGTYFTWNPGLTEADITEEFEHEAQLRDILVDLFRKTQILQRTRTAVVLTGEAQVLELKAPEFLKIFRHFVFTEDDVAAEEREERVRETLGMLVLSSASASRRMRMDDFIALVELDHLTQVMNPIIEMARAKQAGDRARIKSLKWPATVFENYTRKDPVSRVIDANLSAFLSFARVFHDQYVSEIDIAPYLDPTRATPERLTRLVEDGVLDGNSERVKAYIARYTNARKHVKLQRQDVKCLEPFALALARRVNGGQAAAPDEERQNAQQLLAKYQQYQPTQDVLSSLYAEWDVLVAEVDRDYAEAAREPYKDYLARLQTKAIANILTILLYLRMIQANKGVAPDLDEVLLWIHASWSLDNDWAEQAGMTWEELEKIKPGDIKKDWVALMAVIDQLDFKADFNRILQQGRTRFPTALQHEA